MLMFKHPLILLLGAVSLIIPIIIQLISKMRRRKINFPTIFLFEKELIKINRVSKFRDWLLLIIRMILIMIIAIILAQPYIKKSTGDESTETEAKTKLYLLVIDDTFSSMVAYNTKKVIDLWKKEASEFIKSAEDNATFGIAHFNSVVDEPFYTKDKQTALNRISFINPQSQNEFYIPELFDKYAQSLDKRDEDNKYIVIFSDLQKHDWESVSIDTNAQIIIRDIKDKSALTNYAISDSYTPSVLKFTGEPIEIYLTIDSYSNEIIEKSLSIFEGDNRVYEEKINVKPKTSNDYNIDFTWFKQGKYILKAQLEDDNYSFDNYAYQKIYPTGNLRVYVATSENETVIEKALASAIGTEYQTETGLITIDKQRDKTKHYDIILTYGITKLEQSEIDYIINQAKKGRLVIIIYSQKDNPYLLETILKNNNVFGQSLNFEEKYNTKEYLNYPEDKFKYEISIEKLHLKDYKIYFNSSIKTKIDNALVNVLLTGSGGNNLLISNKAKNNVYFLSSDVSLNESNIVYSQAFPILINSLIYTGMRWKFELNSNKQNEDLINTDKVNKNLLEQGKMTFITIDSLKDKIKGKSSNITVYSDISELDNTIFVKTEEEQEQVTYRKEDIELILYLLFAFFLMINLFEIIFSAIRRG